eukprot:COSAG05_NODE_17153_length_331_cov_0.413793_1_plen_45_part_01
MHDDDDDDDNNDDATDQVVHTQWQNSAGGVTSYAPPARRQTQRQC